MLCRFPLFCRSMPPSDMTKYAIFLLNQNLTQLLVSSGQWPTDLRATLANLMSLTKKCTILDGDMMQRTPFISAATEAISSDLMLSQQCRDVGSPRPLEAEHRK